MIAAEPSPPRVPLVSLVALVSQRLRHHWPAIERAMLSACEQPGFDKYLENYRGLPLPMASFDDGGVGDTLFASISDAFSDASAAAIGALVVSGSDAGEAPVEIASIASCFESVLNTTLFLWHGLGDRNYQFRTVVHFCALEGMGETLALPGGASVAVSFSEHGVRVGAEGSEHFPSRLPLSRVLIDAGFRSAVRAADVPFLIHWQRNMQREVCLLVDEWEHENALLAVEHGRIRASLAHASRSALEEALVSIHGRMGLLRDSLAVWCLETFTDLQEAVNDIKSVSDAADLRAEIDASQALLLSAVQKLYLPASVSRHRYADGFFRVLQRWCGARLAYNPVDASTLILDASLRAAMEGRAAWDALARILEGKSHDWTLDCDPSSSLKAVCWKVDETAHRTLSSVYFLLLARKLNPTPLTPFWLSTVASLVQMPETYPGPRFSGNPLPPAVFANALIQEIARLLDGGEMSGAADEIAYLRSKLL